MQISPLRRIVLTLMLVLGIPVCGWSASSIGGMTPITPDQARALQLLGLDVYISWCENVPTVCCDCLQQEDFVAYLIACDDISNNGYSGAMSCTLASTINELNNNHLSYATDIPGLLKPHGCSSCGGGGSPMADGLMDAKLIRMHSYRQMSQHSSLGRGCFTNFDGSLSIAQLDSGAWQVIVDDAALTAPLILTDNGTGTFDGTGTGWNFIRGLVFYTGTGGSGSPTANPAAALSAVLTGFHGAKVSFDIFATYATALPSPWVHGDIGSGMLHGTATYRSGSGAFAMTAGGADIWSTSDDMGYVYQAVTGDVTITARVNIQTQYNGLAPAAAAAWSKSGVMIREGLDADAKAVDCFVTPGAGANFQVRSTTGASMAWPGNIGGITAPQWVQLVRSGDVMTGSISSDGSTWTVVGSQTVPMNTVVYVGLCLTAHDPATLAYTSIDNVSLTATAVDPSSWPVPTTAPYSGVNLSGRLAAITDRNGYSLSVAYPTLTSTAIAADPSLQWQMSSVTDPHGRVISFTYGSTKQLGEWALSSVTMPNGHTVSYTYTNGLLSGVSYPDGTASTITATQDTATNQTLVSYDDSGEEGIHRRKNAYLTNMFYLDESEEQAYQVYNQASNLITLLILPGAGSDPGEVGYMRTSNDFITATCYEGAGKLKQIAKGGSSMSIGYMTTWGIDTTTGVVSGTLESSPLTLNYANDNMYRQGTLTSATDERGVAISYTCDSDGAPTVKTYSDGTTEKFTYDSTFKQVTRYEDRLHRVTINTYDTNGNLTEKEVGILFDGTSDVHQPEYAQYTKSYYTAGADVNLLDTDTDALGNVTTYGYTTATSGGSQRLLASITTPTDDGTGTIPAWAFTYDSYGRKITSTDAVGREVTFCYDHRDRLIKTTYPDTSTEFVTYATTAADKNLVASRKDRQGTLTEYTYDNMGRVIATIIGVDTMSADGSTTTAIDPTLVASQSLKTETDVTYLPGTQIEATQSLNGNLTSCSYDYRQRMFSQTTNPTAILGLTSTWTYTNNLLAETTDPYGRNTYMVYRASDASLVRLVKGLIPSDTITSAPTLTTPSRSTATSNPPYIVTDYGLDAEGEQTSIIDPRNITSTTTFDTRGRMTQHVDASATTIAATTNYLYDA